MAPHVEMIVNTQDRLQKIAQSDYVELLRLRRFAPAGSPYFTDPVLYAAFEARWTLLREGMTSAELVAASKEVGWE